MFWVTWQENLPKNVGELTKKNICRNVSQLMIDIHHGFQHKISFNKYMQNHFKGTVSVIPSDLHFTERHVRFTMVPFKALPGRR